MYQIFKTDDGFTLLELLIAAVVAGFVATVATVNLMPLQDNVRLQKAVTLFEQTLLKARHASLSDIKAVSVTFDADRRALLTSLSGRLQLIDERVSIVVVSAGEISTGPKSEIVFFPDGSSTGGRISISVASLAAHLRVGWLTGRVERQHGQP